MSQSHINERLEHGTQQLISDHAIRTQGWHANLFRAWSWRDTKGEKLREWKRPGVQGSLPDLVGSLQLHRADALLAVLADERVRVWAGLGLVTCHARHDHDRRRARVVVDLKHASKQMLWWSLTRDQCSQSITGASQTPLQKHNNSHNFDSYGTLHCHCTWRILLIAWLQVFNKRTGARRAVELSKSIVN